VENKNQVHSHKKSEKFKTKNFKKQWKTILTVVDIANVKKYFLYLCKKKKMQIANPIYDVVFKYLLEDNKIAKLIISSLLEVEIEELEFRPQEYSTDVAKQVISVYRVDFKAQIKTGTGESKVVLIEIQKAKYTTDLMRFRKYLGSQYADSNNTEIKESRTLPIPIICIYFLGYNIENTTELPIIKVNRKITDYHSKKELYLKDEFIESLTHDSVIIQIPELKKTHRNELEKALRIFETGKVHEVSINEKDYPERYREIIRRLIKALAEPNLRKTMDVEDEIIDDLENKERYIAKQAKLIEEERKQKEEERKQKEEERKQKEEAKKREEEAKKREEEAKQKLIDSAKEMLKFGMPIEIIIKTTGLTSDEIEKL
jgi:hypothetical protein